MKIVCFEIGEWIPHFETLGETKVNFAKTKCLGRLVRFGGWVICAAVLSFFFSGCSDNITLPTEAELAEFYAAGPERPEIDIDRLLAARGGPQEYTIQREDLLEVLMPTALIQMSTDLTTEGSLTHSHMARVDEAGQITLPIVEGIDAVDKTLGELEAAIVAAYWPKYTTRKPSIVVRVTEHKTAQVSVTGAVLAPGVYELPAHQMTLVAAIMAAGGIVEDGAATIQINQPGDPGPWIHENETLDVTMLPESRLKLSFQQSNASGTGVINIKDGSKLLYAEELDVTDPDQRTAVVTRIQLAHPDVPSEYVAQRLCELADVIEPGSGGDCPVAFAEDELGTYLKRQAGINGPSGPLLLPVKGMNIPFSDIALKDGATIEIDALEAKEFLVMGLIRSSQPVVVPYPPEKEYTLLQALAFAGGVDEVADPHYVTVYRLDKEGKVVDAAFEISHGIPVEASGLVIKPGDVISLEYTPRTRMNSILANLFRINMGMYYNPFDND